MPFHAPPATDERSALTGFLRQQQDAFRVAAFGLTDAQAGEHPTRSALTVGVLFKHAAGVQRGWLAKALAAPEHPVDPRSQEEQMAAYAEEFTWQETDTLPGVLAAFDQVCAEVQEAVLSLDLDTPVPVPPAPWSPRDVEAWSVRWVWFHLLEELARHAGHADILREALDGATMYALVAAYEGMPETPWLKPWQPPAIAQ
jgi:hypothetical protein